MKEYISQEHKLGYNKTDLYNDINYYYNLNYYPHGLYLSVYFFKNTKYIYKGYLNMNMEYSHWIDNHQKQSIYKYYL